MQSDERENAYAAGLTEGRRVMAGEVGSTRHCGACGRHYLEQAQRVADAVGLPQEEIVARVTAFHRTRVDAVPDLARYPEMRGERDLLLARYRGMADAGMGEGLIALTESLAFWRDYGFRREAGESFYKIASDRRLRERCRVVYMPESDRGALHAKNVDDPLASFVPKPPVTDPGPWPYSQLFIDGVGSGLHVDEMPPEIFPVDARDLCRKHCATVAGAAEFLVRYNHFWGSANVVVHDDKGNSVALDKASRCMVAVRKPDASGISYVNGMSSFDPEYQAFIDQRRALYLRETRQDADSMEAAYLRGCDGVLRNMTRYMRELKAERTFDKLLDIMTRRDPDGSMCKSGVPCHPDDDSRHTTLIQDLLFLDDRRLLRRQWRGETPVWDDPWEVVQYH